VKAQKCTAIVPEVATSLGSGSFVVDAIHDVVAGRNRVLIANTSGSMNSYSSGTGISTWPAPLSLGGQPTAPPLTVAGGGGSVNILAPVAAGGACAGHCVVLFNEANVRTTPSFRCNMVATATVAGRPTAGANFSGYVFFGDSGGTLYAYNMSSGCASLTSASVGGSGSRVVGAPLVFDGGGGGSGSDEVFVLVTSSSGTNLQHWRYTEVCNNGEGDGEGNGNCENNRNRRRETLTRIASISLSGGNAVGYSASGTAVPLTLAVATGSGRLDLARISTSFNMSTPNGGSITLPNGTVAARAPYWCVCPGPDLIGVGGTNGTLYLFNTTNLSLAYRYDPPAGGSPAINTTPMADAAGDWYFGANDGYVYDVEIPVVGTQTPPIQLFKAARFGPGGAISSSPVVVSCSSPARPVDVCMFFGSTPAGSFFARIGATRIADLRACLSSANGSTCTGIPRLWALAQVGPTAIWGAGGVYVQGWSFYSP
jgi:hypothetical protein